ncbi:DUF3574 domain-containing protein [Tatumella sp. JGM118]|uniref:DUF3574 domain-containing protein n=1 Tax=Tatumella sp. JGM118 TaxID=2799796 RepID=UPI001BAEEF33|nr:DUF3574 domain-containing protein [Tatumella sp. JGM118]MBS0910338.1 DUF3574 domain-containing protein [Tatumella sp. JGM118]
MKKQMIYSLAMAALLAGCQQDHNVPHPAPLPPTVSPEVVKNPCVHGSVQVQTTLWFGLSRAHGSNIPEKAWQAFIDNDVTPRFKDGLSVYNAKGQWLGDDGHLARENSKALMLIHSADKENDQKIEQLRQIYKQRFEQESVMRVDNNVCVDF